MTRPGRRCGSEASAGVRNYSGEPVTAYLVMSWKPQGLRARLMGPQASASSLNSPGASMISERRFREANYKRHRKRREDGTHARTTTQAH